MVSDQKTKKMTDESASDDVEAAPQDAPLPAPAPDEIADKPAAPKHDPKITPANIVSLPFKMAFHSAKFAATEGPKLAGRYRHRRSHPVVLMHGFLGFNRIGPIEYFQNVRDYLELQGFPTYTPSADPLNTFEYRGYEWFYGSAPSCHDNRVTEEADQLYHPRRKISVENLATPFVMSRLRPQGIAEVFLRHRKPVHVIAHSQACVDIRYLTAPEGLGNWKPFDSDDFDEDLRGLRIADTIASVTTVSGPHNGVLIADDTHAVTEFIQKYVIGSVNKFISMLSHDESDLYRAAREFGAEYMLKEFNVTYSDHPEIPYNSIAGITNEFQVNTILKYFFLKTRFDPNFERSDNDGFVPLGSAKWPNRDGEARRDVIAPPLLRDYDECKPCETNGQWTFLGIVYADHTNQIGLLFAYPRNTVFKHLKFYRGIARYVAGEHADDVRLMPNGRWKVPRGVSMMPDYEPPESTTRSGL